MFKRCVVFFILLFISVNTNAAITYIAETSKVGDKNKESLVIPSATRENDLLLVQVVIRNKSGNNTITAPPGWTPVGVQVVDGEVRQSLYYRVASATDAGASVEWKWAGKRYFILGMSVFRGVDTVSPIDQSSVGKGVNWTGFLWLTGTVTAPAVTTTSANTMLVGLYSLADGGQSFSPASDMREIYDRNGAGSDELSATASFVRQTFTGNSGDKTAAIDGTRFFLSLFSDAIGQLVALNEASPLVINSVSGSCSAPNKLSIEFSENVTTSSAENTSNYSLINAASNPIAISSAQRSPNNTVTLTTSVPLNDLTQYTLTVSNVQSTSGNLLPAGTTENFALSCGFNCITDNFTGPGPLSSEWSVGSRSGSFGNPRIVENGRLRLTDASGRVATVATLLNQFPGEENRIEVEFDYYAYNGSGADGIAVTFSDADISPSPGSYGGALGYAQRSGGGSGFAGGWLGVGIDEYGNFGNGNEGKQGGSGFARDSIALRGSGSGTNGYQFLRSTGTLSPGIDQSGSTPNPGHRYKITIDHTMGGREAYITVERDTGSGYSEIIPRFDVYAVNPSQADVPNNWVVSLTGSTGGATNIHEIGDLRVCAAQPIESYSKVDHYEITHSGPGVTCEASLVTLTAHDTSHNEVVVTNNTNLTVTTSPSVSRIISSPATILAGSASTTVYLNQTSVLSGIDIDVTDGDATDLDDGGSEDLPIDFMDAVFRFYADGSNTDTTPIATQISGKRSSTAPDGQALTLRAVRTSTDTGSCTAALVGSQDIKIAYECNDPSTCSVNDLLDFTGAETKTINGNARGASLGYTTVNMNFNGDGEAAFSFNYKDAGEIKLYAEKTVAASSPEPEFMLTGSSNPFVVRPFGFNLDFDGARARDWLDDGALNGSAGNTSFGVNDTSSIYVAAGVDFDMQVTAVNWQSSDDVDNNGIPDNGADLTDNIATPNFGRESITGNVVTDHSLVSPSGITANLGVLTASNLESGLSSGAFSGGGAVSTLSWSEVGVVDITSTLENYLGVTGATIKGGATNVGRFIPSRFTVNIEDASFLPSCDLRFTYLDEPFTFLTAPVVNIQALNAKGRVTTNYEGDYWKLGTGMQEDSDCSGTGSIDGFCYVDNVAGDSTLSWANGEQSYGDTSDVDGVVSLTLHSTSGDQFIYDRPDIGAVSPFDADVALQVVLLDSDSVRGSQTLDHIGFSGDVIDSSTEDDFNDTNNSYLRHGRWALENAFGPETQNLIVPMRLEYWNGSGFVVNTDDNCTAYTAAGVTLSDYDDELSNGETAAEILSDPVGIEDFSNGLFLTGSEIYLTAPYVNASNPNHGSVQVTYGVPAWLDFDWSGDAATGSPSRESPYSTATFGRYRGHDRIIYWRELSN